MNALALMTTTANVSLKPDAQVSEGQLRQILSSGECPQQYLPALSIALTESPLPVIATALRQLNLNPLDMLAFEPLIGAYPSDIKAWLDEQARALPASMRQ